MDSHVILRHRDIPNIKQIEVYRQQGGYEAFHKAVTEMKPDQVIDVVKASGLRGRGGAGFPAGLKWSFIPKDIFPKYVVVNGDESEPGTFKDREIIEQNPHQFIEGVLLTCYAVQAATGYIYMRGEFKQPAQVLQKAVDEARRAGLIGKNVFGSEYSVEIHLHLGAGAYICGEETALLNSLEGFLGQPRNRPPFPAVQGLYAKPTVINNVETLANVPPIIKNGAEWYRKFGTEKSPGTKVFCLSGRVKRPGNYELPLGVPFKHLIYELGGGIIDDRPLKAILPAGASAPLLPASVIDTPMDYEAVQAAGSMLGSASLIILDDTVDTLWAVEKMVKFFRHESCGKCTPCREGTYWLAREMARIRRGEGKPQDIDLLLDITKNMSGKCFCLLGDFSTSSVTSSIKLFRDDYVKATGGGRG
ncbi:MAG: NADH-quinone oxidoreductase subunit NuoF [Chloroflexi bacterium]|nr:NADH-quinone oxidoreductase subunit NuoF [Chloroflexota bacterium]